MARIDHLAHQVGGSPVVVGLLLGLLHERLCLLGSALSLLHPAPQVRQLLQLGLDLLLPGDLLLLLLLDLALGAAALAAHLQHVRSDALRDYSRKRW